MKKIVSVIICTIILLSATATICFADIPTDGFALEEYGQLHYYIPEGTTIPPVADGQVSEGEYSFSILNIIPNDIEEMFDDRFFLVDGFDGTEFVNIYVDYDENNIYLALEMKDDYVSDKEKSSFDIGCGPDMADFIRCSMYLSDENGMPYVNPRNGDNQEITDDGYFTDYMAKYDEENDLLTYEISYDKSVLMDYFHIESFDKIYFRAIAAMYDEAGKVGEAWFAFRDDALMDDFYIQLYRYPHVIHFTEAPVADDSSESEEANAADTDVDAVPETTPADEVPEDTEKNTNDTEGEQEYIPTIGATGSDDGCTSSIAATGIALIISLGVCAIVTKKK